MCGIGMGECGVEGKLGRASSDAWANWLAEGTEDADQRPSNDLLTLNVIRSALTGLQVFIHELMSGQVICTPGLALPSARATSLRSSRSKPALVLAVSHRRGVPMAPLSQVIATRGASTTRPAAFEDASVADAVASVRVELV